MEGAQTITIGDTVWVDDDVRRGIECRVCGFNLEREPIVQSLTGPLRYRGVDRHVLCYPIDKVALTEPRPLSLLEAAMEVARVSMRTLLPAQMAAAVDDLRASLDAGLPITVRGEGDDVPF